MSNKIENNYCDKYVLSANRFKNEPPKNDVILQDDHRIRIRVEGLITTVAFQKAQLCAENLYQHLPAKFAPPEILAMLQIDWYDYIEKMRVLVGGKMWVLKRHVAVFVNDKFLGSDIEFLRHINQSYIFCLPVDVGYYESLIAEQYKNFIEKTKRIYVYFTLMMDGSVIGSLLFMLYSDLLPVTCQYFLNICTAHQDVGAYTRLCYINTKVHRVVKNGWIQCGEVKCGNDDNSNTSLYDITIPDESYCIPHNRRGVLSLANDGKHCTGPQFFVCLKANPWMDYYYVGFGQLIDGVKTLQTIENIATYYEAPVKKITIIDCGEYTFEEEPKIQPENNVFLEHQPPGEGEDDLSLRRIYSGFPGVVPWLDNIIDDIDIRDTASILLAERYLQGLYCLSTDYVPGLDMHLHDKFQASVDVSESKLICSQNIQDLLTYLDPDEMTAQEKINFVHELCKSITTCMLDSGDDTFCAKEILMNVTGNIQKILEIAYEIAMGLVRKAREQGLSQNEAEKQLDRLLEIERFKGHHDFIICPALVEKILVKAVLRMRSSDSAEE